MGAEVDDLTFDNLNYFGKDVGREEIQQHGKNLYDAVRSLFDVSNDQGLQVEYRESDLEGSRIRPQDQARVIRCELILNDQDEVYLWPTGARKARGFFTTDSVDVFLMVYPSKGYVLSEGTIEVKIKSKGSESSGYGGFLPPNGFVTSDEVIPSHLDTLQRKFRIEDRLWETHDAFRLVTQAISDGRLKPLAIIV